MAKQQVFSRRAVLRGLAGAAGALWLPGLGAKAFHGGPGATILPRGLHVSLTGDAHTNRAVTWFTDGAAPPSTILEFDSVAPGKATGPAKHTRFNHRIVGSATPTPGVEAWTHRAVVNGIDPAQPLRYRVGSDAGWSKVHTVAPTPTGTWRFAHFGDQGISARAQMVTDALLAEDFDLLMIAGDLTYAGSNQPVWDAWFDMVEPLLANRVTMAAPGNHEEEETGGATFKARFTHPAAPTSAVTGGNPGSTFYSFDYNRVHFLVTTAGALINDNTLPEELANIELDLSLAAARRAAGQIDFIVVMQHFTIWTDQEGRSPSDPTLVALEENILVRYGVDLLIDGHDHVYQRSVQMAYGAANPLGYVQMMVGTGGASIRLFDSLQAWSAKQFIGIGYAVYEVSGRTIRGKFVGSPPIGLSEADRQSATGTFAVVDEFEFKARSPELARAAAVPPRPPEELLKNYDAIALHTRERNARALAHCV